MQSYGFRIAIQLESMIRRILTGCITPSSEQVLCLRAELNDINVNKGQGLDQTFMVWKEILVSPETWQDISNPSKHLNQLVKIAGKFACNLRGSQSNSCTFGSSSRSIIHAR